MTINPARISSESDTQGRPTMAEMIDRLSRFDGPPEQFLVSLLAVQCHLASADGGAILRLGAGGQVEILAVYPQPAAGSTAPVWLAQSAEVAPDVIRGGAAAVKALHGPDDLYGQPASQHLIMLPLRGGSGVMGVATFVVRTSDRKVLAATQQRLELTVSLLSLYEMRLTLQQRQGDLARLRLAMETTAAVNEQERFKGSAMAFVNEVASRWGCDRAALGLLKGRYVQLKAMSHTEKFSRKMKIVQDIEAAMEEALDQDVEVLHPAPPDATYVARAAGELSKRHGPTAVLSLPIRRGEEVLGVLTLERSVDEPFSLPEIEALRLACDLCSPRLLNLHEQDRWFGARAAAAARKALAVALGPKHTWIKALGVGIFALILVLVLYPGTFRADASFVLNSNTQQVVPAPFDGYLLAAYVRPGEFVRGCPRDEPSWRLDERSVRDWPELLASLAAGAEEDAAASPAGRIWRLLDERTRRAVMTARAAMEPAGDSPAGPPATGPASANAGSPAAGPAGDAETPADANLTAPAGGPADSNAPPAVEPAARKAILAGLNRLLSRRDLYDAGAWAELPPTDRQKDLLKLLAAGRLSGQRLIELNRSLLAAALPAAVEPGPTVLAALDTVQLRLDLKSAEAERLGHLKEVAAAMREDKRAEAQIAQAKADQVSARIELLKYRIKRAVIVSPIDGYVVSGDLRKQLGAP
ncbi:MAG: GAF domain-containing protein, partial [Planctomycetes bacterium]|nr:GAF domain-containing protein [Planctomycetota bacterium]